MDLGAHLRVQGVSYQPPLVLLVLLWATLHDRPRSWACDPANWSTTTLRPARIPSGSTLSRQLRRLPAQLLMRLLAEQVRGTRDPSLIHLLDGKPLPIGGGTDPDARVGRGAGMWAHGYRRHAIRAGRPMPEAYRVEPLNVCETQAAEAMFPELAGGGYVLADGEYEADAVFDAAGAAGLPLVAPREDPRRGWGTAARARTACGRSSCCGAASARRSTRCGAGSRGGSVTWWPSAGASGVARRRGCGGCIGCGPGSGPSC